MRHANLVVKVIVGRRIVEERFSSAPLQAHHQISYQRLIPVA
jgi:hypothetical protein